MSRYVTLQRESRRIPAHRAPEVPRKLSRFTVAWLTLGIAFVLPALIIAAVIVVRQP